MLKTVLVNHLLLLHTRELQMILAAGGGDLLKNLLLFALNVTSHLAWLILLNIQSIARENNHILLMRTVFFVQNVINVLALWKLEIILINAEVALRDLPQSIMKNIFARTVNVVTLIPRVIS